ncbi:hypothetical protein MXD61_25335 [Frankia sp. AgPm24]|uniref:hypothetical protein n=1 Tax=Frankia sp. AgPm24 TaxID=631128 RepID=UPI00200FA708|nr:hypothetical protein [Frankia sp. AgPm24]MCK9925153.1 hypothetical protein [Frankia sp. AgPm24]
MGLLGDALEALSTSDRRRGGVHARLHRRTDHVRATAARNAEQAARGFPTLVEPPGAPYRGAGANAGADAIHDRWGTLLAAGDALRIDWHRADAAASTPGGTADTDATDGEVGEVGEVTVVRGEQWRRRGADGQVTGSRPAERASSVLTLFVPEIGPLRPWLLLSHLRLSALERSVRQGRDIIRLRGTARGGPLGMLRQFHGLPPGDTFDLAVDDATGILVELVAHWDGGEVERWELHDLRVDDPSNPTTVDEAGTTGPEPFDLDAVGIPRDVQEPFRRAVPLARLAAQVDFTLLAPQDESFAGVLREGAGPVVVAHPSGGRPAGRTVWFEQSRGAGMPDTTGWDPITLADGTPAHRWSPAADPDQVDLHLTRAGTQIWIRGRGPAEILALADGLRPVQP